MPSTFRHLAYAVAAIGALCAAPPAGAQAFHNLDAIDEQVAATLGAEIGQPGGAIRGVDRRLRLQACPAPIIVEPLNLGAVTVRCQQIGWRIRVPVQQDQQEAAVRTASAPAVRQARAEPTIRRGDPVALVVITGGFTVSRQAIAEQDGAPGDRIRVRTEPRAAPIIGQVMSDGRVAMGF